MTDVKQRTAAKQFAEDWAGKGYEKGESQKFWLALLQRVYGVAEPDKYISFEDQVHLDHTSFIDGFIPKTHVLIEQKGLDKDLMKPIPQSDGSKLTPFQQAKRYAAELPYSERPRWIIVCNFGAFHIYDMEKPGGDPEIIELKDLGTEYYRMNFLVDVADASIKKEMEISLAAGELVGALYDAILKQYRDPESPETLKSLNKLCVRLVFCLYAEDAGIFGGHGRFHNYLNVAASKDVNDVRRALIDLFKVLDTKPEDRDPYMDEALAAFPYVNGGLFADENIEIPRLTTDIVELLLSKASEGFDWSAISPTIFGAVFESTLNPDTRRAGGMHYTSIENIHKVIDPLFLDELREEFANIRALTVAKTREQRLEDFQAKLASLSFLDPACGSGNFLTETYLSLRRLENEALKALIETRKGQTPGQRLLGDIGGGFEPIKVSISQFYGIEINDFACTVAKTALWIAESQMMKETEEVIYAKLDFLPLKTNANIIEGNALRIDWKTVVPKERLSFIMGNPPFVGARIMNAEQKQDVLSIFGNIKNVGNLDYVCCWYKKAADMVNGTTVRTALVSTNSISQGEQVADLWKPLFEQGVHIDFAYRTFQWDSEAKIKAHVHCVIIGFSTTPNPKKRLLYSGNRPLIVDNINGYLLDADNIFVESRNKPLCDVPEIGIGNKPIDGGNYLFTEEEMQEFVRKEPRSEKYFKLWYGSYEFINRCPRHCLWLGDCPPDELRKMPECMKRVNAVKEFRLASKSAGTVKLAEKPLRFHVENMPQTTYIVIPKVSSEKRRYVPIGFMTPDILCSDLVFMIPNATLYHFGILTSNIHNAWMRAVCGRLKSDYRYSKDIVYNNFPWPAPTPEQRAKIEQTAQAILDARALPKYANCSFADLYGDITLAPELLKAHQENDKAVMHAYGFPIKEMTEAKCVAELMKMYERLTQAK